MAQQTVYIGSVGPYLYDDATNSGVDTSGSINADNGFSTSVGTSNARLLESNSNQEFEETGLIDYIQASAPLSVSDDGNGGVDLSRSPNESVSSLTDSSGGSTNDTISSVSGTGDDSTLNNNLAELTQKLNELITKLQNENIIN